MLTLFISFISLENYYIVLFNGFNYFISLLTYTRTTSSTSVHNPNSFNCYNGTISRKKYRLMFSERRRNAYTN